MKFTRVRRNPRFVDTRVHACVYFVEPTGHGLRELDIQTMKKLSKYVNILPVIGRSDSFTKQELSDFKRRINQDIERFKIPTFQFAYDEDEDDEDVVEEHTFLSQLQPFAIITSDEEGEVNGVKTRVRRYPWGVIDINDTNVSDFAILKSVLLGSHLQDLKDLTHEFLYEAYRTEKLVSVADLRDEFTDDTQRGTPSMSNLADIANSKSIAQFGKDMKNITNQTSNMNLNSGVPEMIKPKYEMDNNSSILNDEELKSITGGAKPPMPYGSSREHSSSITSGNSHVDAKKMRKISETVPYMLRHESLATKQHKRRQWN
ncbi:unnamed protein product [Ambrosiozyma monospora]|uniref:Unnamed protein product n=1 Tax=Ambrosiozyma monospora TaxID=43982 RepID=A0ACB5U170_AMBMO|nr:unnamed protein product [Ambrosiozyma monospora]